MKGKCKAKHMLYKFDLQGNLYWGFTAIVLTVSLYHSTMALKFWITALLKRTHVFSVSCNAACSECPPTCLYSWKTIWLGIKMLLSHFQDIFFQCLLALYLAMVKSEARLIIFSLLTVTFFLCLDAHLIFFFLDSVSSLGYVLVLIILN